MIKTVITKRPKITNKLLCRFSTEERPLSLKEDLYMGLENFSAALDLLIGYNINLYVGEEVVNGKLMGVEADHLIVENENKYIFYYNIEKVQAITKNTRLFQGEEPKGDFQKTKSLTELLNSFRNSWVSILSFNKKRFTGVLSDIDSDFVTLINGEERILIKLTHVSNILKGFIIEEETKSEAKEEKEQNNNKAENNDSKSEDKSDDSKENDKSEKKTKSRTKDSSNQSDKEKKSKHATTEETKVSNHTSLMIESQETDTMVWSEPIKPEEPMKPTTETVYAKNHKVKEEKAEEAAAPMITKDMKKITNEMTHNDKKMEETVKNTPKQLAPPKEVKPVVVKEEVPMMKVEKNNTIQLAKKEEVKPAKNQEPVKNTGQMNKKETKPTKTQETVMGVKTETLQNQSTKTTNSKNDSGQNNNMNVWKPKYQETKVSRFAGEPVAPDAEKKFPFAGWPNRKNRTSNGLFF